MSSHFIPYTTTTYSQTKKPRPDCILLSLHGDDGKNFLSHYPIFEDLYKEDLQSFFDFLSIERDTGSNDVAHATAEKTSQENHSLRIDVLEVRIPRGILDLGRTTAERGIRSVFEKEKHEELVRELTQLHTKTFSNVQTALQQLNKNGCWIDIHTMAPFSPETEKNHIGPDPLVPHPQILHPYNEAYTNAHKNGERRSINIAIEIIEEKNACLADKTLLHTLPLSFTTYNLAYRLNHPHPMANCITAAYFMKTIGRGFFIDIPKDYIAAESPEDTSRSLAHFHLDIEKIDTVTNSLGEGLLEYCNIKKKEDTFFSS
ncbi:MAG TPA: hypothetical protein DCY48_00410 [Candidatus Magasanikbacteria bacterium]|nr:MAG: hypothetical protein A3I74_02690 [Candidatus Magasanikbacteria bacterium RIFCSPLOWO2_02_FULL_47_16]OGH79597.1 MAG: hypothetical protein A3C10_00710 [Candidatus Magasanikbacteria bacterium RIFCSPHIGHO2_02_FULL_48_18]OGH82012.1 MAG: hypothetical protein A3G08_02220 [Candidatus Magasanikbacteria bacterium RIFCSPLOWO2_12_FULL_47_9b]HAZ28230.1 hypothetical protein [Candidatus Magasanikbacteria bacterium]